MHPLILKLCFSCRLSEVSNLDDSGQFTSFLHYHPPPNHFSFNGFLLFQPTNMSRSLQLISQQLLLFPNNQIQYQTLSFKNKFPTAYLSNLPQQQITIQIIFIVLIASVIGLSCTVPSDLHLLVFMLLCGLNLITCF